MSETMLSTSPLTESQQQQLRDLGIDVHLSTDGNLPEPSATTMIFGFDPNITPRYITDPASSVKWMQTFSAGLDYLPLGDISSHHIMLTNARGAFSKPMAESVIGYILYFARGFNTSVKNQAGHFWIKPDASEMRQIKDLKIMIFGTGSIGQAIAHLLNGFDNHPYGVNQTGHAAEGFGETIPHADALNRVGEMDVIINDMPLTSATDDYYNDDFFKQLNQLMLFVNVGRGPSVNENALVRALVNQNVMGAALDVVQKEPLAHSSVLWDLPNVLITPHDTALSSTSQNALFDILYQNAAQYMKDGTLALNQVDPSKGY